MGGLKKTAGRVHRSVSKVVDPLNIMDPGGVLPSSWAAGKKPFQFDKNFGKLQWNLGGGDVGGGVDQSQYDPAMMMYFSQMQTQQAAQAEAARKAQEEALAEAKKQSASITSQLAEQASQQQISQDETTRKAKELEEQKAQQNVYANIGQSAIGGGFDINKARQEQLANIALGSNLPFYNESSNTGASGTGRPANVFNLPKTTGIKFGGQ